MTETGYRHPGYAMSLAEFGQPVHLPRSGGWVLARPIPGQPDHDAIGCYPLFTCADWSAVPADLGELRTRLVSLVFVADPFGLNDPAPLEKCFSHGVVPYKKHHVIDLARPLIVNACSHHRRNARLALGRVDVELVEKPVGRLDEWCALYRELVVRHRIRGIAAFSRPAFAAQLAVPGIVMFRAVAEGETIGAILWYVHDEVGDYHLGAYSARGYALRASYALFWTAAEYFRGRLRWLNLGASAGAQADEADGLARFKRGWTPLTRTAYLCRHVLQPERYAKLSRAMPPTDYFPAYRAGEHASADAA